ncbi:alpha/beta hydrolase [Actinomadura sp. DC4]|uniref:alpha/beta hydrolase n=1 Tax=Actinomadura sp. DC4 TaxID=3055069 RepID=UPI0025B010D6|nr:alpha/beta hydrolase [Actinomadura sp. DC4]MDN3354929.1 alpha/beta hydrolase [Actinomadura sp. DC4]
MKKLLWSAAAVAASAGLVSALPHMATAADRTRAIVWGACPAPPAGTQVDPRQTCGTLSVPLDYRHPGGRQITLAVSRIPAADPAKRRGVMLLNPGGPGGEGLNTPSAFGGLASEPVLAAYDRIGVDPRGVGRSNPVTCGLSASEIMPPYPYPAADGSIEGDVAFARSAAARCTAASGDVLPFITTANTARDMDRIRQALGERRISYWGGSYGTYLGAAYASLFPRRTDRMVLDSAVDPARVWYGEFRLQSKGIAIRFPDAARYAADRDGEVGFGSTPKAVTTSYLALAARLDARPATIPGTSTVLSGNLFRYLTTALLSQDAAFPQLAQTWHAVADLAAGHARAEEAGALQQTLAMVDPSGGTSPGVPADNAVAAAYAIACDDVRWPRDVREYAHNVAEDRASFPLSAGAPANIWPCAFWPTAPVEPAVTISGHGPRDILILQNERDPSTALDSGRGMHKALGARSALVTVDAGGHGVYGMQGPQACATKAADAFLLDGTMPRQDVHCR